MKHDCSWMYRHLGKIHYTCSSQQIFLDILSEDLMMWLSFVVKALILTFLGLYGFILDCELLNHRTMKKLSAFRLKKKILKFRQVRWRNLFTTSNRNRILSLQASSIICIHSSNESIQYLNIHILQFVIYEKLYVL